MFRFEYDKKMSELSCADEDHPLKLAEPLPAPVKNETEGRFRENKSNIAGTV